MNFKIKGVEFSFRFGFFASAAVFSLLGTGNLGIAVICSCIIHECGHIFAAILCNVKLSAIVFRTGGIRMEKQGGISSFSKDIFILFAGPCFNLLAAFFYYRYGCFSAFSVNLILGLFNLLPFGSLDGGGVVFAVLEHFGFFPDKYLRGIALLSGGVICALLYCSGTGSMYLYVTIIFLCICEFIY